MNKIKRLALMLAMLVPFVAGHAYADGAPEPENPKTVRLEDGKVVANIGTTRNAGYSIGASIPIILVFELQHHKDPEPAKADPSGKADAKPAAEPKPFDPTDFLADTAEAPTAPAAKPLPVAAVNLESLEMGVLSGKPTDFKFLGISDEQRWTDGDKDYVRVVVWVWQFITAQKNADGTAKRQGSISIDFLYAVDALPTGHEDWKPATTKELLIDIVPSAGDEQTIPREGDQKTKHTMHAPIIPYTAGLGIALMVPLVVLLGWLTYSEYMRPRRLSVNEIFWLEVDQVIAQAETNGAFELDDYQRILFELRRRYDVLQLHAGALLEKLEVEPNYKTIERVFTLEDLFYVKDGSVSPEQHEELMASIKLLIPRT